MTLKNINLKVPEAEHARMTAAAEREFIPLTSMLRRLFAEYERAQHSSAAQTAAPKMGKRELAFADYRAILDDLPTEWTRDAFDRVREAIHAVRVAGGNVHHTEMPLPKVMLDWNDASQGHAGLDQYDNMTHPQLAAMLDEYDFKGEEPPKNFMLAYRASKPAVPE